MPARPSVIVGVLAQILRTCANSMARSGAMELTAGHSNQRRLFQPAAFRGAGEVYCAGCCIAAGSRVRSPW